ncbi:MAG TPA: HAMP domain-containing sensor histidine kinase [Kofleriaceae bacterium]|nr:HAMP domain-containing sensor histidine kinase [Kofleriaceae bacterium]
MTARPSFLVVDDDVVDRRALRRAIEQSGPPADVDEAGDAAAALAQIARREPDCILLAAELVGSIELVRQLRAERLVPIVLVVSSQQDDTLLQQAADAGITDYVVASELTPPRLAVRIQLAMRTGRAEAESARQREHANRAALEKDEILAVVSHDLRSPLHAISLASEALADELAVGTTRGASDGPARYLGAIERATSRAERLISDLLDASAIENGALVIATASIDAAAIVRQAVADHEPLAKETGARIEARIPDEPVVVRADRERVLQVLGKLIGNSLKHAKGSPIELALEPRERDVVFSVRDNGPGIALAAQPHIFDRYRSGRGRKQGAGLGLAIAHGIVAAHGGEIAVDSTPGEGARFYFTLPRAP